MDRKGYEQIKSAFNLASVPAEVVPEPLADERVQFVTVQTEIDVAPAKVLTALANGGLLSQQGSRDMVIRTGPELHVLGLVPGSITFRDANA